MGLMLHFWDVIFTNGSAYELYSVFMHVHAILVAARLGDYKETLVEI